MKSYAAVPVAGQQADSMSQEELWQQPDFVRAYYVVAEPGGALYSVFGHACLHLVCEAYNLDYFFSYESESAARKILKFLSGNLLMGMTAVTRDSYLGGFAEEGRGVKEYELNLPIEQKRELWRVLDEKTAEGMELPYDYEARGCAYACVQILEEVLGKEKIEYAEWSSRFNRTRREIANDYIKRQYPWNLLVLNTIVGSSFDQTDNITEKLIIPTEVAEVLQYAKYDGDYLLSRDAHELIPSQYEERASWFTPMLVAILLLMLALVSLNMEKTYIDLLILVIVTFIGVVITYLVVVSTLPCSSFNWLIIPFNILPAICWKWRQWWALPYAVIIGLWLIYSLVSPHQLADSSMLVTALAFMIVLINNKNNKINLFPRRGNV
jgi:hypothetical protein